ncbi:hypothetical protein Hanom_Chr15g01354451 [Helianthus anomalus]
MYRLMKRRVHSLHVDTGSWPIYKVKRMEVESLGLWAMCKDEQTLHVKPLFHARCKKANFIRLFSF